eukprot:TRINITY_DN1980_c0_g1_i2.p1 TRINITY_DN1980_c0_g1~~TRINITY_DN1980_c0_g1_i2.p1  ORF type:complete len:566 (-),score=91.37 TRINITY_DN1980_c0_g1_i2:1618-3315(-)
MAVCRVLRVPIFECLWRFIEMKWICVIVILVGCWGVCWGDVFSERVQYLMRYPSLAGTFYMREERTKRDFDDFFGQRFWIHFFESECKKLEHSRYEGVFDFELSHDLVSKVKDITGHEPTFISKWICAMSIQVDSIVDLYLLKDLPQVSFIDMVSVYSRDKEISEDGVDVMEGVAEYEKRDLAYGNSASQIYLSNIHLAHNAGWTGKGVTVLILDSGFRFTHKCFKGLDIVSQRDFLNNDNNTQDDRDNIQLDHGTATLSCFACHVDGKLIGSAYEASVILAQTEYVSQETKLEEDLMVQAFEWGTDLGAQVITASLGYHQWWNWTSFDGKTSVSSIAFDEAAKRGVVPIVSVGNYGTKHLVTPADSLYAISVGAVDAEGKISVFSSRGPTHDGRIKPEVTALGKSATVASYTSDSSFTTKSGTSFSGPLVGGVAALMLQAHPDWTPFQVREALLKTASQATSPGIEQGWGVVDAWKAINYVFEGSCSDRCVHGVCISDSCVCNEGYYNYNCDAKKCSLSILSYIEWSALIIVGELVLKGNVIVILVFMQKNAASQDQYLIGHVQ